MCCGWPTGAAAPIGGTGYDGMSFEQIEAQGGTDGWKIAAGVDGG